MNEGTSPRLTHVTASEGGGQNCYVAAARGSKGVHKFSSCPNMNNVTIFASGSAESQGVRNYLSGPKMTGVSAKAVGAPVSCGMLNDSDGRLILARIGCVPGGNGSQADNFIKGLAHGLTQIKNRDILVATVAAADVGGAAISGNPRRFANALRKLHAPSRIIPMHANAALRRRRRRPRPERRHTRPGAAAPRNPWYWIAPVPFRRVDKVRSCRENCQINAINRHREVS